MIPSLLQFKSRLDTLLTQSFSSNPLFAQTLRESFEHFINRRRDKPAEYIAKYLDNLLRKGDKGLTTGATLEEEMDRALMLFRY
jgi:cullin-4